MKNWIMALRDSARCAMKPGGSSQHNVEAFIEGLKLTDHEGKRSQTNSYFSNTFITIFLSLDIFYPSMYSRLLRFS